MIPRLQRQRGRVRGGTILPGRQNQDPVGPPTSPTPPRSEPSPSTKRTSASESRSARGCAGAVTPLRVRRSGRCVSWCEAHTSARDVPGTGGHWTSDSSESCTTSSAPGHPGPGTGAAARSPGNPRERTPGRRSRGSSVDLAERAAFSPRRAFRTRERSSNRAVSGGGCTVDDGVQYFGGGLSVQDFSWAAVELVLDGLDLGVGDVGEAGALGEVLADQPACVLVGGTLSGGCGDRRSRPGYR